MPGFILHLLHGEMILAKCPNLHFSPLEKKKFKIGLLIPDSGESSKKGITHFYSSDQKNKILKVPDLDLFFKEYRNCINDPFVMGYVAHLYLDKLFFSDYFLKYVHFLDNNNLITLDESVIESVFLIKDKKYITIKELFSDNFLYGDYTKLNRYFVQKYRISPPILHDLRGEKNPIKEVNFNNVPTLLTSFQQYLNLSVSTDFSLSVFSVESMEQALERYANAFIEWCKLKGIFLT